MITIFSKEEEKYFLTFVLKYDNDFETILGEMKKGAKINYEEVEKYMKDVEEKMSYCFQMTIQSILEISLSHHLLCFTREI